MHSLLTTFKANGVALYFVPETMCKKCGSDLQQAEQLCSLCEQSVRMQCTSCDFVSDIRFHADCSNAEHFLR